VSTLASLRVNGQITAAGYSPAPLTIEGIITPSVAQGYGLFPGIEGSVDTTILGIFIPGVEGGEQVLGRIRVEIGGVELPARQALSFFEVTEADDGAVSWSFGVPYFSDADTDIDDSGPSTKYTPFFDPLRPFGASTDSISHYHGPPPGGASIDISIEIPSATGMQSYPLVTDGLVENAEWSISEDGMTMTVNGTGPMQRLDRKAISVEIPAGHGMTLGEMVTWVMEETRDQNSDDWDYSLPTIPVFFVVDENGTLDERNRYKLIQATDRPGIDLAQELLEIVGHRLVLDREGAWLLNRTFDDGGTPAWSFAIKDLLSSEGFVMQPNADGPPVVVFSGTEQGVVDDVDGVITKVAMVEASGPWVRSRPEQYANTATDLLEDTGFSDVNANGLYYREIHEYSKRGDTLVGRISKWWNQNVIIQVPIGVQDAVGDIDFNRSGYYVYTDENVGSWYSIFGFNWYQTQEEIESWTYEDIYGDGIEYLTTRTLETYRWYNPRRRKQNVDDGSYLNGEDVYVNGDCVWNSRDNWYLFSRETTTYIVNEEGFIEGETTIVERRDYLPPGGLYLYNDGRISNSSTEVWGTASETQILYSVEGDTFYKTTIIKANARIVDTRVESGEGYLPAAAVAGSRKPTELADGTPLPNSKWAMPSDTDSYEVTVEDATLLLHRPRWEERISNEIVADEDEALIYARRYLRERATIPVLFSVPYNPLIKPTDWIEVDLGRVGDNPLGTVEAKVVAATHRYDPEGGSITSIEGKVFTV
jgi:hypothetical protein